MQPLCAYLYLYCAAVSFVLSSIGRRMGPQGGGDGDGEGGRDAMEEGMREYVCVRDREGERVKANVINIKKCI